MPNIKDYPVLSATLVAPVVAWLAARYLPGLELSSEQATYVATGILGAGSFLATNLVRSRRTLPDPDATRGNTVRVEPTTYRVRDDPLGGYPSGDTPVSQLPPPTKPPLSSRVRPPEDLPPERPDPGRPGRQRPRE